MGVSSTVAHWTAETAVPLDLRSVGQVVRDNAATAPDRPALVWGTDEGLRRWTWSELLAEAESFAQRVLTVAEPGEVVAIFASNSPDWVFFEYGAALAGITFTAINTALADAEVVHVLDTSRARAVFADADHRGSPLFDRTCRLAPDRAVYDLARWRELEPAGTALPNVDAASALLIQFTSGTTGRPKGAVLSHRAAYNCGRYQNERMGITGTDNWLNALPLHHVGGSICVLLSMLSVGGTTTLAPGFDAGAILSLAATSRATVIGLVPTMQLALLEHPDFYRTDLSSLRLVSSGGSVVPTSLIVRVEAALDAVVVNAYGQSESPSAIMTSPADTDEVKAHTIGRPLPHREVTIALADGTTATFGEIGELLMRSPLTMDAYIDRADEGRTLSDDGWLHTGDLCSMDEAGVISIHGRVRDVIIRGGENIYPAEVEDVMLRHPNVADVAVLGLPDHRWGEVPVACYRPSVLGPAPDAALIEFARESLAGFKVPRRWVAMDSFPLTPAGKVKKFILQQRLIDGDEAATAHRTEPA